MVNRYVVQVKNGDGEWENYVSYPGRIEAIEKMLDLINSDDRIFRVGYLEYVANPITPEITRSQK